MFKSLYDDYLCGKWFQYHTVSQEDMLERGQSQKSIDIQDKTFDIKYGHIIRSVKNNNIIEITVSINLLEPYDEKIRVITEILLLACRDTDGFEKVNEATIERLVTLGAKIDHFHQNCYGWEPLHYVAEASNPAKLTAVIKNLPREKINTLTVLCENALHVLLDYGRGSKMFGVPFQNGPHSNVATIVRCEDATIVDCVDILLKAGINVNQSNFWNETAILLAIKRRCINVIRRLLKVPNIDLDSCKDPKFGKTARELLKDMEIFSGVLPGHADNEEPEKVLFRLLKAGDEESFLRYRRGNIREFANALDGDNEDNSSCTLLQYCFRKGFMSGYQHLQRHETELHSEVGILDNCLVQDFCENGMVRCIEHLLLNGADVNKRIRKFDESLLQASVLRGYYPFLCIILGHTKSNVDRDEVYRLLPQLFSNSNKKHSNEVVIKSNLDHTLSIILDKLTPITGNDSNRKKLNEAILLGFPTTKDEHICSLLNLGGYFYGKNEIWGNKTVVEELDAEVIQMHLDDCVSENDKDEVVINLESLTNDLNNTKVVEIFLGSSTLSPFLNHLVFKSFINSNWEKLQRIFYLNLIYFIAFYIVLNSYILLKFGQGPDWLTNSCLVMGILFLLVFIGKETVQLISNPKNYFKEINNFVEIFFIIATSITYFNLIWKEISMVMTVLSSNVVLLLLLEQVPKLTKYMIIFRTVKFYIKYIIFYFIQFIAFAICFYILFSKPNHNILKHFPMKIFETIILFTGSIDYIELDYRNAEIFGRVIFIIFVFFMAIILNNLLLGLLVTDMSIIQKDLKVFEQIRRASYVVRLNTFLKKPILKRLAERFFVLGKGNLDFKPKIATTVIILAQEAILKLSDDDVKYIDFVLARKPKKTNIQKVLYNYIKTNSRRRYEETCDKTDSEILEKLRILEDKIRDLHELKEIIKMEFKKIRLN